MASFWYTNALRAIASGEIDLNGAGADVRLCLVMSNTTADTEKDKTTLSGFTTLDRYDAAPGSTDKALTGEVVNQDNGNLRAEFDADDLAPAWAALPIGTRQAQGVILYKFITNDADSVPLAWIDTGGFPFWGNGSDVNIAWNAEGIAQLQA